MVAVSSSVRTHSWLLVYCSSSGTLKAPPLLLSLVERQFYGVGLDGPIPDHHLEPIFHSRRDERKSYGLVEGRREGPAGHVSHGLILHPHRVIVARDAPPLHLEADQLLAEPLFFLFAECILADELLLLVQVDGEADARLQGRRLRVELLAVEAHPGLEAQGVARPEPGGRGAG